MALKGYLPPEGRQNVHRIPYQYRDEQGAHKIGNTVIESPEPAILTADEYAQKRIERFGLEELPDDVTQAAIDATREGDTERVAELVDSSDSADAAVAETTPQTTPEDILTGTLGDLDDALSSGDWDTHDKLSQLYEFEEDHKDREGAYQRLEEHRQVIGGDEEEGDQ